MLLYFGFLHIVLKIYLITTFFLAKLTSSEIHSASVSFDLGTVAGSVLLSDHGKDFLAFRGVPYAQPPVDNLRFQPPEPIEPWVGVLDATTDGADCIQLDIFNSTFHPTIVGEEDCLFLNIYTKTTKKDALLPVMVFIHGGGFTSGSGSFKTYGPQRFMDKDVVLVTFNYRLGVFGFLSTGDESSPGNYGLMDQVEVLKWVQRHIVHFGGNPDQVTLFGHSAGSASVSTHVLFNTAQGLFHGAIQQSGSAVDDWAFELGDPTPTAFEFGKYLECLTESTKELINCLRKRSAIAVINANLKMFSSNVQNQKSIFLFRPVVDQVFIKTTPMEQLKNGIINPVPIISGITSDEGIQFCFMVAELFGGIEHMNSSILPQLLPILQPNLFSKDEETQQLFIKEVKQKYFQSIDESDWIQRLTALSKVIQMASIKITDDANILTAKRGVPIFVYKFSYKGHQSIIDQCPEYSKLPPQVAKDLKLVGHGDELQFLFRCIYFKSSDLTENDLQVADYMLNLWTTFAKTRNPIIMLNGGSSEQLQWKPFSYYDPKYMNLDLEPSVKVGYLSDDYSLKYPKTEL